MLKYLQTLILPLFIFSNSNGQYLQPAIDSAISIRYVDGMVPVDGYDSIERVVVNNYIQKEVIPFGTFTWPSQVMDFYPSNTYRHLLMLQYHIGGYTSNGCVTPSYQRCYDSIIAGEIKKKYGNDFFERSRAEADLLDSNKIGLTLPFIKFHKNIFFFIKKNFPFIDTFRFKNNNEPIRFIVLNFKNGQLTGASFAEQVWGIQTSLELMEYSEMLTQTLKKLKWVGPTFNGKPTEKSILFDFQGQTFSFYGW